MDCPRVPLSDPLGFKHHPERRVLVPPLFCGAKKKKATHENGGVSSTSGGSSSKTQESAVWAAFRVFDKNGALGRKNRMSSEEKGTWLLVEYIGDEILPSYSYMGIKENYYKDPYYYY